MNIALRYSYQASLILLLSGLLTLMAQARGADFETLVITNSEGKSVSYSIEVARTASQMRRGLMFRDSMPEDEGMLFVYKPERPASMWMKNTILPLDMFFIAADGTIVNIAENTTPYSETPIRSAGPVRAVLELNAGQARKHQFTAGDKVSHSLFD